MNLRSRFCFAFLGLAVCFPALSDTPANCRNGMCDMFRLSVATVGGSSVSSGVTLPGGGSPSILVPVDLGAAPVACSKTVRVPQPVYDALIRTMEHTANKDYLAHVAMFTPHEQTMLLFFYTIIQQARGLGNCGGR